MAITPTDLLPVTEDTARQVLAIARSIAPCLQDLPIGEDRLNAIAILKAVGQAGAARGSALIKSQRIASAAVEYIVDGSWFSTDQRAGLRALCSPTESDSAGHPLGDFPDFSRVVSRMFPEDC